MGPERLLSVMESLAVVQVAAAAVPSQAHWPCHSTPYSVTLTSVLPCSAVLSLLHGLFRAEHSTGIVFCTLTSDESLY